jgi:hypothetical protein
MALSQPCCLASFGGPSYRFTASVQDRSRPWQRQDRYFMIPSAQATSCRRTRPVSHAEFAGAASHLACFALLTRTMSVSRCAWCQMTSGSANRHLDSYKLAIVHLVIMTLVFMTIVLYQESRPTCARLATFVADTSGTFVLLESATFFRHDVTLVKPLTMHEWFQRQPSPRGKQAGWVPRGRAPGTMPHDGPFRGTGVGAHRRD